MKLLYVANARMPTEKAHGLQIAKMCEAFAETGVSVTLVVPERHNPITEDLFSYYRVKRNFSVRRVPVLNPSVKGGPIGFLIEQLSFAFSLLFSSVLREEKFDVVFSRDIFAAWLLCFRHKTIFEMHTFPEHALWLWGIFLRSVAQVFSTNKWKMDQTYRRFGIPYKKLFFYPNGFDPKLFEIRESKEELRRALELPIGKPIALYTGHLYGWKGAHILARAARLIPDVNVVFVGGTEKDIIRFTKDFGASRNIFILGHRPYYDIPKFLKAADILVLPNSAISEESRTGTSPIKLFEYMASGKPIIASDLPSIREVVSDREVMFVRPDDPNALAYAIQQLVKDSARAERLGNAGFEKSKEYSWIARVRAVLNSIK